jgi:TRAP-type mannitol/chloroaromatic compound transport system permease large subunit
MLLVWGRGEFFFDWLEIILIVIPIFAPIIVNLDFTGHIPSQIEVVYWFAILIAVNLQTSFLTPPFGFALFYVKGSAPPSVQMTDIYRGIVPFVILQLLVLAITIALPDLALWLPRKLLGD